MTLASVANVVLSAAWTGMVGFPLVVAVSVRYGYGLVRAKLGRPDVLDRVLEANAWLTGWVTQHVWSVGLLKLTRMRLRVRELTRVDWARAHVICANHASVFDILALVRVVPPPFRFVAKSELLKWPVIGWVLRPAGQIVVDRADHERAMRSMAEAARHGIRGQVIFFVEGTRTQNGELQPFKKGAFHFAVQNQLAVLPTAIGGTYEALARKTWWHLQTGREIDVLFCPTIEPAAVARQDDTTPAVEALLATTRTAIAGALAGDRGMPSRSGTEGPR